MLQEGLRRAGRHRATSLHAQCVSAPPPAQDVFRRIFKTHSRRDIYQDPTSVATGRLAGFVDSVRGWSTPTLPNPPLSPLLIPFRSFPLRTPCPSLHASRPFSARDLPRPAA